MSSQTPLPQTSHPVVQKKRSIIYIDGFNFYYGAIKETDHQWLDLQKYFTLLRQDDHIQRIHYFTATLTGANPRANQEAYLRALATFPLISVTCSNHKNKKVTCRVAACTFPGDRVFQTAEEKRTDVELALQMLDDAYQDHCDRFILVSGDSDLVPAVERVRGMGKEVVVYVPARRDDLRGAAVELRAAADRAKTLPLNLLRLSHLPDPVPDGLGGVIDKPNNW
jgi:6-hydroxy-3-succinoylpyridine 3-monooxygenase